MIAGIGIHIIIAFLCAIHVVRSGQQLYWLFILFFFPGIGSLVYVVAIYLPQSRLRHGARKAVSAAARVIDPQREVREARAAFDFTPTAQNQMRLAAALLDVDQAEEAAEQYQACLSGPFASDLEIRFGAAKAFVACQRWTEALRHLEPIRQDQPSFRAAEVSPLLARALAGAGRNDEARAEFESCVERFGSFEARAEYAIWAYGRGDQATAEIQQGELDKITARWNSHTRQLNDAVLRRLAAARR